MKKGTSERSGQIELTSLADGFYEGLFYEDDACGFGISSNNRLRAAGNSARPTCINNLDTLFRLANSNKQNWTIKYAGTPVWQKFPANTPRQKQKNLFMDLVFEGKAKSKIVEAFGAGIFGINDPIGLGKKFCKLLSDTIIVIDLSSEKSVFTKTIQFEGRSIKVIVRGPKQVSSKDFEKIREKISKIYLTQTS